ncbi:NADH-quinone oxidoreductase subunit L [Planctomicrobium piriforme]|uniref:NADH-quinone oxidoreductase subunit L n=1 Tax=Planctomicrobium piriforme TaxID=1576369 RepID=A0A1I3QTG9_9PLAN|nr:NADH-quinone oxidoreductase subunit L [Planctomicrobium piriforme]SFJ36387.1 NADH-quinone oxidoreductase subunit L [Planctomicrobium piriforme]
MTHTVLWLIPLAPLTAAAFIALLGPKVLHEKSHIPCILALLTSFVCSLILLCDIVPRGFGEHGHDPAAIATGYDFLTIGQVSARIDLRADAMTAIMLSMVTGVSSLVAIFASGYMHGDRGYARFFAAVSGFVFSMCMLVLAGNFVMLFFGWEAVGLCSYLLIGFWFRKPSAAAAAKKAFVVNRIGDFGFLLGIFLVWTTFGSLNFADVFGHPERIAAVAAANPWLITLTCLLLFLGAMGKSAQFPLHVWLPDAMEGPTPVSALIHAATMVTAGVYMVARCTPLFIHSPNAQMTVAAIGAITALVAALTALTQNDLKRVLAYSTVSQLAFLFMSLGAAAGLESATPAIIAAMFHLFTHAFFKALLFLSAGSVMHSMGDVIDMRRFSGLRKALPVTHWTFLCGALALAGFPLLSGFWSKDEILGVLSEASHHPVHGAFFSVISWSASIAALLTAFYTFRAYFMTFWGPEKFPEEAGHHPHDAPPAMAWPLRILAVCAVGIGGVLGPTAIFGNYLHHAQGLPESGPHAMHISVMVVSGIVAIIGIALAWLFYVKSPAIPGQIASAAKPLYLLSLNKFYFDEIYLYTIVIPLRQLAKLCTVFDIGVVDQIVNGVGKLPRLFSNVPKVLHNGLVPSYALVMFIGVVASVLYVISYLPK